MIFLYGTKLAEFQDLIISKYKSNTGLSKKEYKILKSYNIWIELSKSFAPNNLVIRHLALQKIFNINDTKQELLSIIDNLVITNNNHISLWTEGYTYWEYTKDILSCIPDSEIKDLIINVDRSFAYCSCHINDKIYPPFYGDCRFTEVSDSVKEFYYLNYHRIKSLVVIHPLLNRFNNFNKYEFKKYKLGLNMHTQSNNEEFIPTDNIEHQRLYYTGYKNKYPSIISEVKDMINKLKR